MSLTIYHGPENWILKGIAIDLETAFKKCFPSFNCIRLETSVNFSDCVGSDTSNHLFLSSAHLNTDRC